MTPAPGRGVRVLLVWAAALAATFGANLLISATSGFSLDESWYLQVIDRVVRGDVLYRDVYYLGPPLSVQVTAALAHVFGTGVLVEKAVVSLSFAGEIAFATLIARECGISRRSLWLVWLASFVYAQHFPNPPYRGIGSALMLGAFWTLIAWLNRSGSGPGRDHANRATGWLATTGILAGACFATMPNHGLLTLGSAAAVVVLRQRLREAPIGAAIRQLSVIGLAFAAVVLVVILPVALSGSLKTMVEDVAMNKEPYLRFGGASYWGDLASLIDVTHRSVAASLGHLYRGLVILLAPLAVAGLAAEWRRSGPERRVQALALLLLVAGGIAGAYPRLNRFHLSYAMPGIGVGLAFSAETWRRLTRLGPPTARVLVAVWLLAGVAATSLGIARDVRSDARTWSTLPHFQHTLVLRAEQAEIRDRAARMIAVLPPSTLLVTMEAGVYYLVTGLRNPTPYDQSLGMNFGPHGQDFVIAALGAGKLRPLCLASIPGPLRPAELEQYVRTHLVRGEDLGVCTVYR